MTQIWSDLVFTHYEADPKKLRAVIPPEFEIDTYRGKAYVGLVAFEMTDGRAPYVPFGLYSPFGQINLRTYIQYKGVRGVYFFSLDADHFLGSWVANFAFGLPYRNTEILHLPSQNARDGLPWIQSRHTTESFEVKLTRTHGVHSYPKDSLEIWLTDLDHYFQKTPSGCIASAQLWHEPFEIQAAQGRVASDRLPRYARDFGIKSGPSFHYVRRAVTYFWPPEEHCN